MSPTESRPSGTRGVRQALGVEYATIGWNAFEAVVAIVGGIIAASVALTSFGIDSGIELFSALIVTLRLRSLMTGGEGDEVKERFALRLVAIGFYALALYVIISATIAIVREQHPADSPIGIGVTAAAIVVMRMLASRKRHIAQVFDENQLPGPAALLRADAAETALCAMLSVTTLIGLGLNAAVGWWWADPVASLAIVYFAVREGREAWEGEMVCSDDD